MSITESQEALLNWLRFGKCTSKLANAPIYSVECMHLIKKFRTINGSLSIPLFVWEEELLQNEDSIVMKEFLKHLITHYTKDPTLTDHQIELKLSGLIIYFTCNAQLKTDPNFHEIHIAEKLSLLHSLLTKITDSPPDYDGVLGTDSLGNRYIVVAGRLYVSYGQQLKKMIKENPLKPEDANIDLNAPRVVLLAETTEMWTNCSYIIQNFGERDVANRIMKALTEHPILTIEEKSLERAKFNAEFDMIIAERKRVELERLEKQLQQQRELEKKMKEEQERFEQIARLMLQQREQEQRQKEDYERAVVAEQDRQAKLQRDKEIAAAAAIQQTEASPPAYESLYPDQPLISRRGNPNGTRCPDYPNCPKKKCQHLHPYERCDPQNDKYGCPGMYCTRQHRWCKNDGQCQDDKCFEEHRKSKTAIRRYMERQERIISEGNEDHDRRRALTPSRKLSDREVQNQEELQRFNERFTVTLQDIPVQPQRPRSNLGSSRSNSVSSSIRTVNQEAMRRSDIVRMSRDTQVNSKTPARGRSKSRPRSRDSSRHLETGRKTRRCPDFPLCPKSEAECDDIHPFRKC